MATQVKYRMKDDDCVHFLQWALPQLLMRWEGFRRVRKQVCKRISRRLKQLQLTDCRAYQVYLQTHDNEWAVLDGLCYVTVTRFYRDKRVFEQLEKQLLPQLAQQAMDSGRRELRIGCLGCASGEEPYTLSILWQQELQARYPALQLKILATDFNAQLLQRAKQACYPAMTIKNIPTAWKDKVLRLENDSYCLRPEYQAVVEFMHQDVREDLPPGPFDMLLCRNLVFTYYTAELQKRLLMEMVGLLCKKGVLLIGVHESLPAEASGFQTVSKRLGIYRYLGATSKL